MFQFPKQLLFQISIDMTSTIRQPMLHVCALAASLLTGGMSSRVAPIPSLGWGRGARREEEAREEGV